MARDLGPASATMPSWASAPASQAGEPVVQQRPVGVPEEEPGKAEAPAQSILGRHLEDFLQRQAELSPLHARTAAQFADSIGNTNSDASRVCYILWHHVAFPVVSVAHCICATCQHVPSTRTPASMLGCRASAQRQVLEMCKALKDRHMRAW